MDCSGSWFFYHLVDKLTPRGSCGSGDELKDISESLSAILLSTLECYRLGGVSLKLSSVYHSRLCQMICTPTCPIKPGTGSWHPSHGVFKG